MMIMRDNEKPVYLSPEESARWDAMKKELDEKVGEGAIVDIPSTAIDRVGVKAALTSLGLRAR